MKPKKYGSIAVSQINNKKLYNKLYYALVVKLHPKWTLCKEAWGKCAFCGNVKPVRVLENFGAIEIRSVAFGGRGKIYHNDGYQTKNSMPDDLYDKSYKKYSNNILDHCVSLLKDHYTLDQIQKLFGLSQDQSSQSNYEKASQSDHGDVSQLDYGGVAQSNYKWGSQSNYEKASQSDYGGAAQSVYGGEQN